MRMAWLKHIGAFGLAAAVVLAGVQVGRGQEESSFKVAREKIIVEAPNAAGMVKIKGSSGAIEGAGWVAVNIYNVDTGAKVTVNLNKDGSFEADLAAAAGEKVRVLARDEQGNRRYTTLTVPLGQFAAPAGPAGAAGETVQGRGGAVVVLVIDLATGELVGSEQVAGIPQASVEGEAGWRQAVAKLARKCLEAVQGDLSPTRISPAEAAALGLGLSQPTPTTKLREPNVPKPAAAPKPAAVPKAPAAPKPRTRGSQ